MKFIKDIDIRTIIESSRVKFKFKKTLTYSNN